MISDLARRTPDRVRVRHGIIACHLRRLAVGGTMGEVVRLKSRFVSSRPGQGEASHSEADGAAARLVEGILRRKSFHFQQRTGKLDMRAIGRVDVDRVIKDVDIDTLQAHLENITFADVTEDDLRLYSDQCFLNLFRLSQLLLEYLLNVQDTLATSLEALALKHGSTRKAVDKGRAELHVASEQDRALKREIRQKRATIARYEQLLALPAPPAGGAPSGSNKSHGSLQACLTCGKMFTTAEFLQQHIVRKHASRVGTGANSSTGRHNRESGEAENKGAEEEKAMFPSQLKIFVQTSTGQCLDIMVHRDATIAQLRGYIDSTAGFTAAGASKFLVYRGLRLHDGQTLKECNIPTDSQLVLLDSEAKEPEASGEGAREEEKVVLDKDGVEESAAVKQMSTLVDLMRQQMEWTMRSEDGRREQGLGAAEALETRMRGMEASLPRRLEEFMEESVGGLKSSLSKALGDMEELHAKRSNAGAIQDDEDETKRREGEEKSRLALLSADVERVSKENAALLQELADAKASAAQSAPSASPAEVPRAHVQIVTAAPSREQAPKPPRDSPVTRPPVEDPPRPQRKASSWDLTFPSQGSRRAATIKVPRNANCESVCERIAEELDVVEARVVLRNKREGAIVPLETLSGELQRLHEEECLELEVLQGTVLSDSVVDGLVDFYEQHVPAKARASGAISRSMAEMDETAKRHALGERNGMGIGTGAGKLGQEGGDATEHAEKQIDNIRAQLSATLTGGRRPSDNAFLAKRNSISSNTPGLGLSVNARRASGGFNDAKGNIFGDGEGEHADLSRAELEKAVEERKRARPAGIERQMENVSMSMEEQLNILLEEAEEELEQLEQDSLGSETYSSTVPSVDGAASSFVDPLGGQIRSPRDGRGAGTHQGDGSRLRVNMEKKASAAGNITHASSRRRQSESIGRSKTLAAPDRRSSRTRYEYEDIPKSDWGRTLDTTVSIPEGPEERADEHEANASLEMMDASVQIMTSRGQRT